MSGQFTISKVWGERFHRRSSKVESPTKDWIFYISRPTLERLRNPKNGETINLLRNIVHNFLNEDKHKSSSDFQDSFSIETIPAGVEYSTMCYPFDINDEIDDKLGVLIHIADINDGELVKADSKVYPEFNQKNGYPTMFDMDNREKIKQGLRIDENSLDINPPGVTKSDPMWFEFSSSKILPTDQLIADFDDDKNPNVNGKFRSIISHQYIEVRLIRSRILGKNSQHYNREQLDAISAYESLNSGFSNFAGPPGTGKSTILHMVCAHHIFQNFIKGEGVRDEGKRILYYVPSAVLKEEAKREIKSILINIYEPVIKALPGNIPTKALTDLSYIEFVSQEDLFIITSHTKLDPKYNILRETSNETLIQELELRGDWEQNQETINSIKKGIRNVFFGLLGGRMPAGFADLNTKNRGIDLFRPLNEENKGRPSVNHQLNLNKFIANERETKKSEAILKDLKKAVDALRSKNKLYNGADSQFWDPAAVIEKSSHVKHSDKSIWGELGNSIDYIMIDEVQDISITEIRHLLTHFGNRHKNNPLKPFRLVCAGDENQNVNHLLFTEQNEHVRYLYKDWVLALNNSIDKSIEGYKLSHQLGPSSEKNLVSGYRVFNQMIPYVNDVLEELRKFHAPRQTQEEKTSISKSKLIPTPFGRNGVCMTMSSKIDNKNKNIVDACQDLIIKQLKEQLGLKENDELEKERIVPIRIAFTFDKDDYDRNFPAGTNPFHDRLTENGKPINQFAAELNDVFTTYTQAFDNDDELWESFLLKGVMDVGSIKGLTMPITIVLPSKSLMSGKDKLKEEDLSLYLVQITRAQYMNIILQHPRVFDKYSDTIRNFSKINGKTEEGIQRDKIESWLTDILLNSAGFDYSFGNLFERTLNDYTSDTLWDRLERETKGLEKSLQIFICWLRELFKEIWKPNQVFIGETFSENFLEDDDTIRYGRKTAGIDEISQLLEFYLIGDYLNKQHIEALKLFLTVNMYMKNEENNFHEQIQKEHVISGLESWTNVMRDLNDSNRDYNDDLALCWFELICRQEASISDNDVHTDLKLMFDENKRPETPLPRISMGPWRIKQPPSNGEARETYWNPWMDEESQFFNIHPDVLNYAIVETDNNHREDHARIKLFLGMVSGKSDIFVQGMKIILDMDDKMKKQRENYLNWYVDMFCDIDDNDAFKSKVIDGLVEQITSKADSPTKTAYQMKITEFLETADTISRFEDMVKAFNFGKNWGNCANAMELFERTIRLTDTYVTILDNSVGFEQKYGRIEQRVRVLKRQLKQEEDEFWGRISRDHDTISRLAEFHKIDPPIDRDNARKDWLRGTSDIMDLQLNGLVYIDEGIIEDSRTVEKIIELYHSIAEENSTLNDLRKQKKTSDERMKEIGADSATSDNPRNPFRRDGKIFEVFSPLFSNSNRSLLKQKFDLLWGVEDLLNHEGSFIKKNDFQNCSLEFQRLETDSEITKMVHRCVNAFVNTSDKNINSLFDRLNSSLHPEPDRSGIKIYQHKWIDGLMKMLETLKNAYDDDPGFCKDAWNITEQGGNLYDRIYIKLFDKCKRQLPKMLLFHTLNLDIDIPKLDRKGTVMGSDELKQYLESPQARLVYSSISDEFINEENAIHHWKNTRGYQAEEDDENRKDPYEGFFLDFLIEEARQRERKFVQYETLVEKRKRSEEENVIMKSYNGYEPVIHERIVSLEPRILKDEYVNAAAFRALANLCEGNISKAADEFTDAGLLNHAAALRLNQIYSSAGQTNDLIKAVALVVKQEYGVFLSTFYQTPTEFGTEKWDTELSNNMGGFMYGIGPNNPTWKGMDYLDKSKRERFANNSDVFTRDRKHKDLVFFKHATFMDHFELIKEMLEEIEDKTTEQTEYLHIWEKLMTENKSNFKTFHNHKADDKTTKYIFRWSAKSNENQPKPGYAPANPNPWYEDVRIVNRIQGFLMPFLTSSSKHELFTLNKVMSLDDWGQHLTKMTGISGATLGYVSPRTIKLAPPSKKKRDEIKQTDFMAWFEQNIEKKEIAKASKDIIKKIERIKKHLGKGEFEYALDWVTELDENKYGTLKKEMLSEIPKFYERVDYENWKNSEYNEK